MRDGKNYGDKKANFYNIKSKSDFDLMKMVNDTSKNDSLKLNNRSNSCHYICMEEVVPEEITILEDENNKEYQTWQMPLNSFIEKKRGKRKEDRHLSKNIRRYYKEQDDLIAVFEEAQLSGKVDSNENIKLLKKVDLLAKISFGANLVLLITKAIASGLSGSLSIISAVIDSVVDLISGALMWWSNRAIKKRDPYLYPQGRTKLEPVSIIVLSVIMALASIAMIQESVEKIISFIRYDIQDPEFHNTTAIFCVTMIEMFEYFHLTGREGPVFGLESISICVFAILLKLILLIICHRIPNPSTKALAQDHRNDVISNTGALACGLIGYRLWKYADPLGAIAISIYIIISWFKTGTAQIKLLTGHTARPDFLKKLTWITLNHHEKVVCIDTIRAFHFGNNFLVEVDIVLPEKMSMREAHDIGETLQTKLEQLDEVERAFVHLDYESEHHPLSEHKAV